MMIGRIQVEDVRRPAATRKDSAWGAGTADRPICLPKPQYTKVNGETPPYRSVRALDSLRQFPESGIRTITDLVRRSASKYGLCHAVASRTTVAIHTRTQDADVDGKSKTVELVELTGYTFTTYTKYEKLTIDLGCGLINVGLKAREDKLCIWAQTW